MIIYTCTQVTFHQTSSSVESLPAKNGKNNAINGGGGTTSAGMTSDDSSIDQYMPNLRKVFHKRALYLHKRALYLHKRALYLHKRALYLHKDMLHLRRRTLYFHEKDLLLRKRSLYLLLIKSCRSLYPQFAQGLYQKSPVSLQKSTVSLQKRPISPQKSPVSPVNESSAYHPIPQICARSLSKEPCISARETYISAKEPCISL